MGELSTVEPPTSSPSPTPRKGPQDSGHLHRLSTWVSRNVTIEPMLFLKMVAESNFKVVGDTLEIDRICRVNLNYTEEECELMDNGNLTHVQDEVQIYQNNFNYVQTLMDSFIPLIVLLLVGPLTDRFGRKPAMISVLVGFIGMSLVYTLTALNPSWPVQVLYLGSAIVCLGGTWVVFNMAVYSYIADVTTVESRTKRMGLADAVWYAGIPIGTTLGGYIYKWLGFAGVYILSMVLWTICLLYTLLFIKESRRVRDYEVGLVTSGGGILGPAKLVWSTFASLFKPRRGRDRIHIVALIGLKLGSFLVQGHQMYLWARKVLGWDATQFSTWSGVEGGFHQIGMVAWLYLGRHLNFHDCTIANGGVISILLWSVTLACITGPNLWWLVIVASTLGLFEASIEPPIRSMLTAVAGVGEEGRILSALGVLESVWLSVDRALFTLFYNTFINSFPQIDFVFQAGFSVAMILAFVVLQRSFLRARTKSPEAVNPISYQHTHDL